MAKFILFGYLYLPILAMLTVAVISEKRIDKKKAQLKAEAIKEYKDSLFFMDLGEGEKYYQTY